MAADFFAKKQQKKQLMNISGMPTGEIKVKPESNQKKIDRLEED